MPIGSSGESLNESSSNLPTKTASSYKVSSRVFLPENVAAESIEKPLMEEKVICRVCENAFFSFHIAHHLKTCALFQEFGSKNLICNDELFNFNATLKKLVIQRKTELFMRHLKHGDLKIMEVPFL